MKDAIYGMLALATLPLTATACLVVGLALMTMRRDPDEFFFVYFNLPWEWPWMLESWIKNRKEPQP